MSERPGPAHLAFCLREIHRLAGEAQLDVLLELLRNPSGTFRFTVSQALAPPPEGQGSGERLEQLTRWAQLVVQAREASRRNAIMAGEAP